MLFLNTINLLAYADIVLHLDRVLLYCFSYLKMFCIF